MELFMSGKTPDGGRIRRRIAEIDQHISVLMKERDELIFAERVLDRLGGVTAPGDGGAIAASEDEPDGIEEALAKLENRVGRG
jgi:hypothetical protein